MEWINHPASPFIGQNVIFAAMIFLSMLYFTISILGGALHSDVDQGIDSDSDADAESDTDSDSESDHESEHETDDAMSVSGTIVGYNT